VQAIAPWLSQKIVVGECCGNPSSLKRFLNHRTSRVQCVDARYSASHDDRATTPCCFELHESGELPIIMMNPDIDFLESPIPQSESDSAHIIG